MILATQQGRVQKILQDGLFPSITEEGVQGVNLEDSFILHCSRTESLQDEPGFVEFLNENTPTFTFQGKRYWVITHPKNKESGEPTFPETLRMPVVMGKFEKEHGLNTTMGYDIAGFEDIIRGSNPTALGVGIYSLDEENQVTCVGTSDIKTGAVSEYDYDKAREKHVIVGSYIKRFIKRYLGLPLDGQPLVYELNDESHLETFLEDHEVGMDQIQHLCEDEDGNFVIDIPRVVVSQGTLPVHTLLVGDIKNIANAPDFEIGQLAKSDDLNGSVMAILSAGLLQIYEDLTKKNKKVRVGFSLSPDFLTGVYLSNTESGSAFINARLGEKSFSEFQGTAITEIIMKNISKLYKSIKLFPLKNTKVMLIRTKDGKIFVIPGIYQGETIEIPAYIETQENV